METTIIYEVPGLKVSAKMRKAIEKLERKFGKLNKRFFVERNEGVREREVRENSLPVVLV